MGDSDDSHRAERLRDPTTAAAVLDEIAGLDAAALQAYESELWRTNELVLAARARRQLLKIWERLDRHEGVSDALARFASYVLPIQELRADLDALSVPRDYRGFLVRAAVARGLAVYPHDDAVLETLRTLATDIDGLPRADADILELRILLLVAVAEDDVPRFLSGVLLLELAPVGVASLPEGGGADVEDAFACFVEDLATRPEMWVLRTLARNLAKVGLTGEAFERVLAALIAWCAANGHADELPDLLLLVPAQVTSEALASTLRREEVARLAAR